MEPVSSVCERWLKQEPKARETLRGILIRVLHRKYPAKLFRKTPQWDDSEAFSLAEETLTICENKRGYYERFSPSGVFFQMRQTLYKCLLEGAPFPIRIFVQQMRDTLKPCHGFRRKQGWVGLKTWNDEVAREGQPLETMLGIWKGKVIFPRKVSVIHLKRAERVLICSTMLEMVFAWIRKPLFYNGIKNLAPVPIPQEISFQQLVTTVCQSSSEIASDDGLPERILHRPQCSEEFESLSRIITENETHWTAAIQDVYSGLSASYKKIWHLTVLEALKVGGIQLKVRISHQAVSKAISVIGKRLKDALGDSLEEHELEAFRWHLLKVFQNIPGESES